MNTIIQIVIFITMLVIYPIWINCVNKYFSKKAEGKALKEDSQEIEYQKEKGKNIATQEDIKMITSQIESVKNEISFENQRKNNFINQRTERLLNILYLTEKFNEYKLLLMYDLYDKNSSARLTILIENINNTLLQLIHEYRIAFITLSDKDLKKIIASLIEPAQEYAGYMGYIASTAILHLTHSHELMKLATQNDNNSALLDKAIESNQQLSEIRTEFEQDIDAKEKLLHDCQIKYLSKLNLMFKSDFHIVDRSNSITK